MAGRPVVHVDRRLRRRLRRRPVARRRTPSSRGRPDLPHVRRARSRRRAARHHVELPRHHALGRQETWEDSPEGYLARTWPAVHTPPYVGSPTSSPTRTPRPARRFDPPWRPARRRRRSTPPTPPARWPIRPPAARSCGPASRCTASRRVPGSTTSPPTCGRCWRSSARVSFVKRLAGRRRGWYADGCAASSAPHSYAAVARRSADSVTPTACRLGTPVDGLTVVPCGDVLDRRLRRSDADHRRGHDGPADGRLRRRRRCARGDEVVLHRPPGRRAHQRPRSGPPSSARSATRSSAASGRDVVPRLLVAARSPRP